MRSHILQHLLLAVAAAHAAQAHTSFTNFFVDGKPELPGACVRMNTNDQQSTFPLASVTSNDMACGIDGQKGVPLVCPVDAGDSFTFEFRDWPDGSQPGSIDVSHKGPCAVYMKKVDNAITDDAIGGGWFKIHSQDYDTSNQEWCTDKIRLNNGHLTVNIPNDLAPGYYLVRSELLALHQADKTPPDPQFYVGCAQIFLSSSGSAVPPNTVSIPGYVNMATPAMTYNIYTQPLKLPFPDFGPPVFTSGSKRSIEERATAQTLGLLPANCVLQNGNWCGIELASYSDQSGCWNASKDCWSQSATCYSSAGPTGSANCHIWENKCTAIQNNCNAGNYNGPPNAGKNLTPPLPELSGATAAAASSPEPSASADSDSKAAPPVQFAAKSSGGGSIDTCGSNNGGQTCAAGYCCSSHGYCGMTPDYCGSGCQSGFGKCGMTGGSKLKRRHMNLHKYRHGI